MNNYEQQGRKIGKDLYPTLSEDHQALIGFGRVSKELIDLFQKGLRDELAKKILIETWSIPKEIAQNMTLDDLQKIKDVIYPYVIEGYTKGFVLGLMDGATDANKMLV